jgi:hypothetical protein
VTRLTSAMRVSALVRRVHAAGGSAMVLAKGDATGGGVLVLLLDRGAAPRFRERGLGNDGGLITSGPSDHDSTAVTDYWQRRCDRDPDLWVVEVDVADGERFAEETIGAG